MLQAVIFGCPAGLRTCLAFVNAMLTLKIPRVDALLNSRGVAFDEPSRRGIRPIAICATWLHLAAIVCIRILSDAGPSCPPLQLGVGIQRGADNIGHTINADLHSDPTNTVVLSHFWVYAFNTIHWAALIAAVASRHPSLVLCANFIYSAQSTVRFSDKESGTVDITSARGVRQRDPFGPLLFAHVLQLPFRLLLLRTLPCTQLITPMTHTS
jgi:hypothetical protein